MVLNKKGAINLSINMIIVLILAIIILGFALSFITVTLGKAEESLWDQFPTIEIPGTNDRPIGVPNEFKIKPNAERNFMVNVLNTGGSTFTSGSFAISCSPTNSFKIKTQQAGVSIASGESKPVGVVFEAGSAPANNAICTIEQGGLKTTFFLITK